MRNILRKCLILTVILVGFATVGMSSAMACPNCKFANETESNRPKAYMYSILFMIGMPATIFTGFGISFYRMTRNAQLAAMAEASDEYLPS
jgi:Na+-driven multidrug efflux pump